MTSRSDMHHPASAESSAAETRSTLSRLLELMISGPERSRAVVAIIARVIATAGLIILPYVTGRGMDVMAAADGTTDQLTKWVTIGMVAAVVYLLLSFVSDRMFAGMATRALNRLQTRLAAHIQTLSMGFFFKNPVGELTTRLTNDAEVVAVFYEQGVGPIIRAGLQVVLITIVMLLVNVPLTIAALVVVPFLILVAYFVMRVASPAFERLQSRLGDVSAFQGETLAGHKVIISKQRETWAQDSHEDLVKGVYVTGKRAFLASLMQFPATLTLIRFQTVIIFVVGTMMVINDQVTLGVVMAFTGYATLLASPLSQLANLMSNALNAIAGGDRIFEIIDEEPTITDAPNAVEYEFKGGRIEFKDVDFGYVPGQKILRNNTFDVQPGEHIGICGPTGAGKSTLINIMTRYYDIDGGQILIDGQDLSTLTQASLRRQIGVVLQEAFLFTDTVMNNLKYAREGATDEEAISAAKKANAHDFIMDLPNGYDTMLTGRGANLSQGERQMITIARAMVADPKLLILDEATSNVDTRTEKLIQDGIRNLMDGKTSFSIAHRLATIRDSNDIMVLNGGVIVEYGPHDELMAQRGFYHALYMSQFKGKAPGGEAASAVDFIST